MPPGHSCILSSETKTWNLLSSVAWSPNNANRADDGPFDCELLVQSTVASASATPWFAAEHLLELKPGGSMPISCDCASPLPGAGDSLLEDSVDSSDDELALLLAFDDVVATSVMWSRSLLMPLPVAVSWLMTAPTPPSAVSPASAAALMTVRGILRLVM